MKNLKLALEINGTFSIISGLLALVFSSKLQELFELGNPSLFYILGPGLMLFGTSAWLESRKSNNRSRVMIITISDYLWVLGSAVVLLLGIPLNAKVLVALIAVAVLWFAIHQTVALRGYE